MGHPQILFFVPSPAGLEVLLDLQLKHRLGSDGSSFLTFLVLLLCFLLSDTYISHP